MSKTLGLDVGTKTMGVAISDAFGWTAQGLTTLKIDYHDEKYGLEELSKIVDDNNVSAIVVGLPKNMNNSIGESGERSLNFSEILANHIPNVKIIMWEDRKSTRLNSSHVAISYAFFCLKKKKCNIL